MAAFAHVSDVLPSGHSFRGFKCQGKVPDPSDPSDPALVWFPFREVPKGRASQLVVYNIFHLNKDVFEVCNKVFELTLSI